MNSLLRRTLAGAVALAGIAAAVAMLIPDDAAVRGYVRSALENATGRDVRIGALQLSLLPTPSVAVTDLQVANPPWATHAWFATIGAGDIAIDALALLRGAVHIERIDARDVTLHLEQGPHGETTWQMRAPGAPAPPGASYQARLDALAASNVRLVHMQDGRERTGRLDVLRIERGSPVAGANTHGVSASGSVFALPLTLDGTVSGLAGALVGPDAPRIALRGTLATFRLAADGVLGADGPQLAIRVSGELSTDRASPLRHVDARGTLAGGWRELHVDPLTVDLDRQRITGTAELDLRNERAVLRATLAIGERDAGAAQAAGHQGAGDGWPAIRTAFDPTRLLAVPASLPLDLQLALRAGRMGDAFDDVSVDIVATRRELALRGLSLRTLGGTVTGTVVIRAASTAEPGDVRADSAFHGLSASRLASLAGKPDLAEGPVDGRIDLQSSGRTPEAWVRNSRGTFRAGASGGRVRARALETLVGGVRTLLDAVAAPDSEWVTLNCAVAAFDVAGGVATSRVLVVDTTHATLIGEGRIDLANERVALLVKPHPKSATLNLSVPVRISGPVRNPEFSLDEAATARRIGGVVAGIVFPPALVAAFVDFGYTAGGCLPARAADGAGAVGARVMTTVAEGAGVVATEGSRLIERAGASAEAAARRAGNTVSDTGRAVEETLETVGEGLQKLFGN